ncbi:MAG: molybdenum cofactor guanylyltransferase MobA [Alphaproteobacteria bacterium]|jgi:molybdopterin-guanine dinucleotide biosynthesis protein A|nr:molybdenum cofactor guanylyltransferase MobA [Alphaproteobacteria bacterium]
MTSPIVAVLLAGGLARRMGGGDKCLREVAGRPLLSHVIERILPQVDHVVLNANGDPERFSEFGLPVIVDVVEGNAGPLAGILTGMDWAARHVTECEWVVSVPTDAPFLPMDYVARMMAAIEDEDAELACASTNGRTHPVAGLWALRLMLELRSALIDEDIRKIDQWTVRYRLADVEFSSEPIDPFFNANRPEDLKAAEVILAHQR